MNQFIDVFDSLEQAATFFNSAVSRQAISNWVEQGKIDAVKVYGVAGGVHLQTGHQAVAARLASSGRLGPHTCVCWDVAHGQGSAKGQSEALLKLARERSDWAAERQQLVESRDTARDSVAELRLQLAHSDERNDDRTREMVTPLFNRGKELRRRGGPA